MNHLLSEQRVFRQIGEPRHSLRAVSPTAVRGGASSWNYHCIRTLTSAPTTRLSGHTVYKHTLTPKPWQPPVCSPSLYSALHKCHTGTLAAHKLGDWLLLLHVISLRSIRLWEHHWSVSLLLSRSPWHACPTVYLPVLSKDNWVIFSLKLLFLF